MSALATGFGGLQADTGEDVSSQTDKFKPFRLKFSSCRIITFELRTARNE